MVTSSARLRASRSILCTMQYVISLALTYSIMSSTFEELDVVRASLRRVVTGEGQHLVGHVHPVGESGGADSAGG